MYETSYHRASSLADAAASLAGASDGKLLAGGQTLIPTMKQRLASPSDLIDIRRLDELRGIEVAGGNVTIGAASTHAEVAGAQAVRDAIPALAELAGSIGDPQVRHMGTLGGSLANNDPAADYPAGVLGLGATIVTDRREIAADDFFRGLFETALADNEIIVKVVFPIPQKAGYAKFPHPASRFAMCGVMVGRTGDGTVRVAVTGAGADGVFRDKGIEAALAADWSADAIAEGTVSAADMMSDIHGSAEYRAHLVTVMARRALAAAG